LRLTIASRLGGGREGIVANASPGMKKRKIREMEHLDWRNCLMRMATTEGEDEARGCP